MTATSTTRARRPSLAAASRRWSAAHPGWWLWAAAGVAWLVLAAMALGALDHDPTAHHHVATGAVAVGPSAAPVSEVGWAAHWLVMVVAMMWPLVVLQAEAVRRRTRGPWRVTAVGSFAAAFTGAWLVVGIGVHAVTSRLVPDDLDRVWLAGWLAAAALVTGSLWRVRILRSCGRLGVIAPAGRRSLVTAATAGVRVWKPCAVLCGPVMVAMVVPHPLWLLAAVSAAVWFEQRRALTWRHPLPTAVLAVAAGAALLVP